MSTELRHKTNFTKNELHVPALDNQRTLGDGMETAILPLREQLNLSMINLRPTLNILYSMKPVIPKGKVIHAVPKYSPSKRAQSKYLTAKPKDPKFVPYEPYKGAVEPIIKTPKVSSKTPIKNKNNIDIQDLVKQMAQIRTDWHEVVNIKEEKHQKEFIPMTQWEEKKVEFETDIKNLRETNAHLENQLKFQAQVNSELKTLLVAAVGEDLETRVQHLTESKFLLAKELLNSAYNLTSHQEQTEWLSGQCEVWRSKFLASSLMVEELARWKSALTNRINDSQSNIKQLLDERKKVRQNLLSAMLNLKKGDAHADASLKATDILHLSDLINTTCKSIFEDTSISFSGEHSEKLKSLPSHTPAEMKAIKILKNPVTISSKPDPICNAVMGAAYNMTGGQIYLQHSGANTTCCSHCKGEIQEI